MKINVSPNLYILHVKILPPLLKAPNSIQSIEEQVTQYWLNCGLHFQVYILKYLYLI